MTYIKRIRHIQSIRRCYKWCRKKEIFESFASYSDIWEAEWTEQSCNRLQFYIICSTVEFGVGDVTRFSENTHTHTLGEYRWSHTRSFLFVCPQRGEYSSCPLSEPPKSYLSSVTVCTLALSPSLLSALKSKQMWKYFQSSWEHNWQIQR